MPVRIIKCFQNLDKKSLSRSEIISKGRPFSQYQFSKKRMAQPSAVRVVFVGMIRTSEWRRSVMVKMQSNPLSMGKGPMKSSEIESQRSSGTGRGCKGPEGFVVELLFRIHSEQEGM